MSKPTEKEDLYRMNNSKDKALNEKAFIKIPVQ